MAMHIPGDVEPFDYGYRQGFQEYLQGLSRQAFEHDGSREQVAFVVGYELGYDHAVAYVRNREECRLEPVSVKLTPRWWR